MKRVIEECFTPENRRDFMSIPHIGRAAARELHERDRLRPGFVELWAAQGTVFRSRCAGLYGLACHNAAMLAIGNLGGVEEEQLSSEGRSVFRLDSRLLVIGARYDILQGSPGGNRRAQLELFGALSNWPILQQNVAFFLIIKLDYPPASDPHREIQLVSAKLLAYGADDVGLPVESDGPVQVMDLLLGESDAIHDNTILATREKTASDPRTSESPSQRPEEEDITGPLVQQRKATLPDASGSPEED